MKKIMSGETKKLGKAGKPAKAAAKPGKKSAMPMFGKKKGCK